MTDEANATPTPETSPDQQERVQLILTYVEMAEDCEAKEDGEGAEFLYRGANDALIDLLECDSARQET
ncbi:MAG: hypothetical protein KY468_12280 [Armatimonadetes bacterium]|nr:hypothetical protein [Armatimonadota bacterium]